MNKSKETFYSDFKILGQNIRKIRKRQKLSQEELAFMISSARNYVGCVERAEKVPSLAFIFNIKKALKCNLSELFNNLD